MTSRSAFLDIDQLVERTEAEFREAQAQSVWVWAATRAVMNGIPKETALKACIVALVKAQQEQSQMLMRALDVKPRRYRLPDGSVVRFDAPDSAIPIEDVPPTWADPDGSRPAAGMAAQNAPLPDFLNDQPK